MTFPRGLLFTLAVAAVLTAGCATLPLNREAGEGGFRFPFGLFSPREVATRSAQDEVRALLEDYRPGYVRIMGDTLATLSDTLTLGYPESGLGNFTADALRFRAARELRRYVHAAVIDRGSLTRGFSPGPVTRGQVHELMPYDNTLVVLTLTGRQIHELALELLGQSAFPMSGMRLSVQGDTLGYLLIDRSPLEMERDYLVATSSWLAAGNGPYRSLWNPSHVQDTGIPLLDVFLEAFTLLRPDAILPDQRVSVTPLQAEQERP